MNRDQVGRGLEAGAAGLLALTTVAVGLAWGGFRPGAWQGLMIGWGLVTLLGGASWVVRGRIPALQPLLVGLALALAGWVLLLQPAGPPLDDAFTERQIHRLAERWPESFQLREPTMVRLALVLALGAGLVGADLGRRRRWRQLLVGALLLAAVGPAVVGLVQNFLGVGTIYGAGVRLPGRIFGPFFHHTAAGAQLNLGLPLAVALAVGAALAWWRGARPSAWMLAGATVSAALLLAAHFGNVARMPPVFGLVGAMSALSLGWWWTRAFRRPATPSDEAPVPRRAGLAGAVLLAGMVLVVVAMGWVVSRTHQGDLLRERWQQLLAPPASGEVRPPLPPSEWESQLRADYLLPSDFRGVPFGDRGAAWATAGRALADRPWAGWGPGGWTVAASQHTTEPFLRTFYLYVQFTHQDTLQLLVVWGLPGGLLLAAILLAPWCRPPRLPTPADAWTRAGLAGVGVALFLQAQMDFPLQIPSLQAGLVLLTALAWADPREATIRERDTRDNEPRRDVN